MTVNLKIGQVWEDIEGFRWKIVDEQEDGYKCSCVLKPARKKTVGKFKVGQSVVWKSEGQDTNNVFNKLILDENGVSLSSSGLVKKDLIKSNYEGDRFDYGSLDLETYNPYESDGNGDAEGKGQGAGRGGVPEASLPEDDRSQEQDDWLAALALEEKEYKIDVTKLRKKHIDGFYAADGKGSGIKSYGKKIQLKGRLTEKSVENILASIKKDIDATRDTSYTKVQPGQLWANIGDGHVAKIIYVAKGSNDDTVFFIRFKNSKGEVCRHYIPSQHSAKEFSKFFAATEYTSDVTSEELSVFPSLAFVKAQLDKKNPKGAVEEESEEMKMINMAYSETYKAIEKLSDLLDKIKK